MFLLCCFLLYFKELTNRRAIPQTHGEPGAAGKTPGRMNAASVSTRISHQTGDVGRMGTAVQTALMWVSHAPWEPPLGVPFQRKTRPAQPMPSLQMPACRVSQPPPRTCGDPRSRVTCVEGVSPGRRGPQGTEGSRPACQGRGGTGTKLLPPDCSQLRPRLRDL